MIISHPAPRLVPHHPLDVLSAELAGLIDSDSRKILFKDWSHLFNRYSVILQKIFECLIDSQKSTWTQFSYIRNSLQESGKKLFRCCCV